MSQVLASAGDDVKLWEGSQFVLSRQLNPHDQNVSRLCWANENSFLASVSLQASDVALTNMKTWQVSTVPVGEGCLCIDLNDNARYMLVGSSDSIISVWDLKSNKLKKKYKGHKGPVTCAKFSAETRFIASGSETGEIILYNVTSGQGYKPLVAPNIQAVRQLQYSQHRRSLLGATSDEGTVALWDCAAQRLVQTFSAHQAPATDLSFSPINDIFLISVGLDKRIACYDVQSKKTVKVMNSDAPLTSIDTLSDGVTVAVGSTRGKILHYDLRMGSSPVTTVDAHRSSVQALSFQTQLRMGSTPVTRVDAYRSSVQALSFQTQGESGNTSKVAASASKQSRSRQLPASPKTNAANRDSSGGPHLAERFQPAAGAGGGEVFSPLREGFQSGEEAMLEQHSHSGTGSFSNLTINNLAANSSTGSYSGGIFSPLNENQMGRGSSGLAMSPLALSGYGSAEHTGNNSGQPILDYNRLAHKEYIPNMKNTKSGGEDGALVNGSSTSGHLPHLTVTSPPQGASSQKHVAFRPEEPDQFIFSSNDHSSSIENSASSPELNRPKPHTSKQQQIGMSASPSFPNMHLEHDSPGSVSSGGANSAHYGHRPGGNSYSQPTTPDGVNPQSADINVNECDLSPLTRRITSVTTTSDNNNISPAKSKRDGATSDYRSSSGVTAVTQRGEVLSSQCGGDSGIKTSGAGSRQYSGDLGALAEMVRGIVQEEVGALRTDMRTMMREEIEELMYQVHTDIVNLQVQMLVQFEIQQNEMLTLFQQYSVNQDLVAEIERLQQEVKRLKTNF